METAATAATVTRAMAAAAGAVAMETVATEIAAEPEAFLEISLADLKPAIDKVISNLKCRALQARHFFVLELR